jgi:hypothetical protein
MRVSRHPAKDYISSAYAIDVSDGAPGGRALPSSGDSRIRSDDRYGQGKIFPLTSPNPTR